MSLESKASWEFRELNGANPRLVGPGIGSAHSHAFQRALRNRTQSLPQNHSQNFWSWRNQMYALANRLDPDSARAIARLAYAELLENGVTAVGEFHYLHRSAEGHFYEQKTAMAEAMIEAARSLGMRISLLLTVYESSGFGADLLPEQKRFQLSLPTAIEWGEDLSQRYAHCPLTTIGLALHSVRAVSRDSLEHAAEWISSSHWAREAPLHIHVAEQVKEVDDCLAQVGQRPVEWISNLGLMNERTTLVHANHVLDHEIDSIAQSKATVCVCRSTERDLGDGFFLAKPMVEAGIPLCTGVDGYAASDPFEEARAIEWDERTRQRARNLALDASGLAKALSGNAYRALGKGSKAVLDEVQLDLEDFALADYRSFDANPEKLLYSALGACVKEVSIFERKVVSEGQVPEHQKIARDYRSVLHSLE